ncbi:MAG: hypothetical protein ACYDEF_07145 [Methanosarcina sp.]
MNEGIDVPRQPSTYPRSLHSAFLDIENLVRAGLRPEAGIYKNLGRIRTRATETTIEDIHIRA